jgi:hypothetical protein
VSGRQLSCENCGGPLTYGSAFCAYCRRPLQWGRHVAIERGEQFFVKDFSRDPLPGGGTATQKRHDGALVSVEKENWERWGSFDPKLRNACVAVRGVAFDASADFGVYARMHAQGDAKAAYQLKIYPAFRSWRLRREAWIAKTTHVSSIVDWEFSPLIGGIGTINEVELRFFDSVFQVVVNGQNVTTVVDASFGFGLLGWVCGSHPGPSQVLLQFAGAWRAR